MNKKILFPLLIILLFVGFVTIGILQYRSQKVSLNETIPLIPPSTTTQAVRPAAQITQSPGIPKQTDILEATKQVADPVAQAEKDKFSEALPLRQENISTSVGLKTTFNIYSFRFDPSSVIRLEIYGINYNLSDPTGPNAIAFKETFLAAKKQLTSRGVVLKNLQIIYGNRQYIQDTATYWVKTFKLLD